MTVYVDVKAGDRIELLEMPNDPCPIDPGTRGTVTYVEDPVCDDRRQVWVEWDNGRGLMICEPPDRFRVLAPEE